MKNSRIKTMCCALFLGTFAANAAVITVSNNTINAGQYTNLQTAVNNASVDDTIYVHGSPTTYGNVTVSKRLTIIGAGYQVTGTQYNWNTLIGEISLDSLTLADPLSGSKFAGLTVDQFTAPSGETNINNITIERCYVTYNLYVFGSGWTIRHNIIAYAHIQDYGNLLFTNNVIGVINDSDKPTVVISNNLFSIVGGNCFTSISNAIIANNIFYYMSPTTGCTFCTFDKNITTNTTTEILPYGNNTGSGNLNNVNPNFVGSATIPSSTVGQNTVWNYDWHLKTISPGKNAGTDGTDIGIYGGNYPMQNLSGATSIIPQMKSMNINNAVVPQGSNLNVDFKAKKQN